MLWLAPAQPPPWHTLGKELKAHQSLFNLPLASNIPHNNTNCLTQPRCSIENHRATKLFFDLLQRNEYGIISDICRLSDKRKAFSSRSSRKLVILVRGTPARRKAITTLMRYTRCSLGNVSPTGWDSLSEATNASAISLSDLSFLATCSFPVWCLVEFRWLAITLLTRESSCQQALQNNQTLRNSLGCSLSLCLGVTDFSSFAPRPRDRHFPVGGGFLWTAVFRARSEVLGARKRAESEAGSGNVPEELALEQLSSASWEAPADFEELVTQVDRELSVSCLMALCAHV